MKRFLKRLTRPLFILVFTGTFMSSAAFTQDRDPFSPGTGTVISKMKDMVSDQFEESSIVKKGQEPLVSSKTSSYRVIGVIISENKKLAAIKALNGTDYIVKPGDPLGSEGGKISDITLDSITVKTESDEFKIPVSNKIEAPIEQGS